MKEYGGYIELDTYRLPMLHDGAIALNCGRNCLAYLIKTNKIQKIKLPYFLCDSVFNVCKKYGVEISYYHIDENFRPKSISLEYDEWLYIVNYYGQIAGDYIKELKEKYERIIVDNAQAYFDPAIENVDTIYTCRKFFGVTDGAFLYTHNRIEDELPIDESFERIHFILGRFERTASEFYEEYVKNNQMFANEPIKSMSKLTYNLLHGIDYQTVKNRRTRNFAYFHKKLKSYNGLKLGIPDGAFAYPFLVSNGKHVRKELQQLKIYVPTLWPNVVNDISKDCVELKYADNILPLPCDQRYNMTDINYIIELLLGVIK